MLRREAASWLARLQSGHDPNVESKFQQWRNADPRHAAAFDRVRRSYEQAGLLRHSSIISAEQQEPSVPKSGWRPLPAIAAAAAIVILVPLGLAVFRDGGSLLGGTETLMLMTQVGQIRQVELADGSKVTLDTATKVEVQIGRSRRTAHLRYGRARFRIAPAMTPFVVETEGTTITAGSGVIDVEQVGAEGHVQVLAGAADVRGSARSQAERVTLGAGEAAKVDSAGAAKTNAVAGTPDWTKGMLQFDGTPLAEAVALANRYSQRHIILVGDLKAVRVTGAFRAGDTRGLAKALAAAFSLSLQQRADGSLILSRSASSPLSNKTGG
ncbi:MAG: FecR domain-containing protein [Pseudomonadota bacterium]